MADELHDIAGDMNEEEEEEEIMANRNINNKQKQNVLHKTNKEKEMNSGKILTDLQARILQAWQVFWQKFAKMLRKICQKGVQMSPS